MSCIRFSPRHSLALLAAGSLAAAPLLAAPAGAYDLRYGFGAPPPVSSTTLYDYPPYTNRPAPAPVPYGYGPGAGAGRLV